MEQDLPAKPPGYAEFLGALKERIRGARVRAALAINSELLLLYWHIGREILARQKQVGWGGKVIQQLADDLRREFPDMKGLSRSNLLYMRKLAEAWADEVIVQQLVGQIPWGHNVRLLDRLKNHAEREWYARATIEHGWSRAVLDYQIDTGLCHRQGKGVTNFERTLPAPRSELAQQVLKDPYNFDFLGLGDEAHEREIHRGLLKHLRAFLTELGAGFAFVGSEYHLEVEGEDFFVDLLFYHLKLRCFVVIELKTTDFKPEHAPTLQPQNSQVPAPPPAGSEGACLTLEGIRGEPMNAHQWLVLGTVTRWLESTCAGSVDLRFSWPHRYMGIQRLELKVDRRGIRRIGSRQPTLDAQQLPMTYEANCLDRNLAIDSGLPRPL